jgi:hypothetical protein
MPTTVPPGHSPTTTVVRVGPIELRPSRAKPRHDELARIFGGPVTVEEASTVEALAGLLATTAVAAIVIDAAPPGQLPDVVRLAGGIPVLQPRWHLRRGSHGDVIQRFDGYSRLIGDLLVELPDGELAPRG